SVVMPDGLVVASGIEPRGTSVRVAPETDALEVWADVSNPDSLLRPGMRVTVQSTFSETRETE
ncbi:MAG: efflux RND transporter periplasmic adaptor subunit, partial [Pseudomonadota bacterium]